MTVNKDVLAAMAKINKEHGDGTICFGSDMRIAKRFTSGSLAVDIALGGGWPGNQWVEVYGKESHGKTYLVLKTLAANQKADPNFLCLWVAAEHYDVDQAEALGVDNDRVLVLPTQAMELAYQKMLEFATDRSVDMIVLDSYPALVPDEEAEKDMDEATMALGARLTGKFFRKSGAATKRSMTNPEDRPILGMVINQLRDAIGKFSPHGTPTTTPGGNAKNYAFYTRVEVKRDEFILEPRPGKGKVAVGQVIKVKTIKNKSAAPQQIATVHAYFRDAPFLGFRRGEYDLVTEIVTLGILYDVIKRGGAYFNIHNGEYDANGKPKLRFLGKDPLIQAIREDVGLQEELYRKVLEASTHADERAVSEEEMDAAASAGKKKVTRRTKAAPVEDKKPDLEASLLTDHLNNEDRKNGEDPVLNALTTEMDELLHTSAA